MAETKQLTTAVKAGEAIVGTAVEYGPYVEYGTRRSSAHPYLTPSQVVVNQKYAGTYKKDSTVAIRAAIGSFYDQKLGKNVEIKAVDPAKLIKNLNIANEKTLATLAAEGAQQAKTLQQPITGNLRRSIMWKTIDTQGGYGKE